MHGRYYEHFPFLETLALSASSKIRKEALSKLLHVMNSLMARCASSLSTLVSSEGRVFLSAHHSLVCICTCFQAVYSKLPASLHSGSLAHVGLQLTNQSNFQYSWAAIGVHLQSLLGIRNDDAVDGKSVNLRPTVLEDEL